MVESINYKEKYLKYKAKYLKYKNMQGGLIGDIPCDKLDKSIDIKNLPDKIKEYINLITIPNTNIYIALSLSPLHEYKTIQSTRNTLSNKYIASTIFLSIIGCSRA